MNNNRKIADLMEDVLHLLKETPATNLTENVALNVTQALILADPNYPGAENYRKSIKALAEKVDQMDPMDYSDNSQRSRAMKLERLPEVIQKIKMNRSYMTGTGHELILVSQDDEIKKN